MPVVSLSCPQCGKPATEYDENKWQCLTCGSKFVYEKPIQQPSVNLTKVVKRAGESVEKTLIDFGDRCKVTNIKVTFDRATYAIANIASLSYEKEDNAEALTVIGSCWLGGLVFGIYSLANGLTGMGLLSLLAIVIAFGLTMQLKPVHKLKMTMNSGEVKELKSRDLGGIKQIEQAIHTAITASA